MRSMDFFSSGGDIIIIEEKQDGTTNEKSVQDNESLDEHPDDLNYEHFNISSQFDQLQHSYIEFVRGKVADESKQ